MTKLPIWSGLAAVVAAGTCLATATMSLPAQDIALPPGGDAGPQTSGDYEALTRGPLHEAFANPYVTNPEPGLIVEQQPPEPIDEIPPDEMPEGENVVWIPGYWGWDPDAEQFIWISGLWRNMPSEHRWVPGYWASVDGGFQWVAGFWSEAETEELVYLPEPPQSLEQGPNVAPPDGDYFWIPGCWVWQDVRYDWRPGYWAPAVADWVWIPDQYMWTPYGCVFVPGYWDYTFVDRGVMFAPVLFETAVIRQPAFQYVPTVVIDTAPLMLHMFVSPTYSHYYYGDYYAYQPVRQRFDFYPWAAYGNRRSLYDPLLTYYQWSYGQRNVNIIQRLTVWNQYFVRNESYRPPRTFSSQRQFLARIGGSEIPIQPSALAFASPLSEFARDRSDQFRFQRVGEPRRQRFAQTSRELRAFQQQRSEFEVAAVAEEGGAAATRPEPGQPDEGRERRRARPGEGQRRERRLEMPEATNIVAAARAEDAAAASQPTESGEDQPRPGEDLRADQAEEGRPAPGRREPPPERPRPGQRPRGDENLEPNTSEEPTAPGQERGRRLGDGERAGDRPRTPAEERPVDRPRLGQPGINRPDTPGRQLGDEVTPGDRPLTPGEGQLGNRPSPDRPDLNRPATPGQTDETPSLPGTDAARPGQERPDTPGRRPGDEVTPGDRPLTPGEGRPGDRPRPGRPDLARPVDETTPGRSEHPGIDRPGVPGRIGDTPGLPGAGPNRPDPTRTGVGRSGGDEGGPDFPQPGDRRGPNVEARPDTPEGQQPRFPRFGVGRNRPQGPGEPAGPGQPGVGQPGSEGGERPTPDRSRGRRGFDPFGGLPPGAEEGSLTPPQRRTPQADRQRPEGFGQPGSNSRPDRGRGVRPGLQGRGPAPGLPGAGPQPQPGSLPGAGAEQPSRGRRGEARPGGPGGPQPGPGPRVEQPQPGPPPQADRPRGGRPPQASPGGPPATEEGRDRGRGRGRGNGGNDDDEEGDSRGR